MTVEENTGLISSRPAGSTFRKPGDPRLWERVDAGGGEYTSPPGTVSCVAVESGVFNFLADEVVEFRAYKAAPVS